MDRGIFDQGMDSIASAVGRKWQASQFAEFYASLRHIPNVVWSAIALEVKEKTKTLPTIKDLKDSYQAYLESHPEMFVRMKTPCRECGGEGFLVFWRKHQGFPGFYETICACGSCENYRDVFGKATPQRMTKEQIARNGWNLTNPQYQPIELVDLNKIPF